MDSVNPGGGDYFVAVSISNKSAQPVDILPGNFNVGARRDEAAQFQPLYIYGKGEYLRRVAERYRREANNVVIATALAAYASSTKTSRSTVSAAVLGPKSTTLLAGTITTTADDAQRQAALWESGRRTLQQLAASARDDNEWYSAALLGRETLAPGESIGGMIAVRDNGVLVNAHVGGELILRVVVLDETHFIRFRPRR